MLSAISAPLLLAWKTPLGYVPPKKAGLALTWKNSPHAAQFFISCLLSKLSVPWNREQADSLTQGIIEARPRYQEMENPAMCRVFLCPLSTHSMSALPPEAAIKLILSGGAANDPNRTLLIA